MFDKLRVNYLCPSIAADLCHHLVNGIMCRWDYLTYLYRTEYIYLHPEFGWKLTSQGVQLVITHGWSNGDTGMWKV